MNKFIILLLTSLVLVGCDQVTKQDIGTITGGALGGVLGNQIGSGSGRTVATIGGTLVGAFIGGSIGKSMDEVDRLKVSRALENNRTNHSTTWTNPDSKAQYTVTPTRTYYHSTGQGQTQPCREYTTTAIIGGESKKIYGKACRMDDGSWKVVN
ncbi:MAG: RT0821/Lpp0805 family surface protein [Gammaproteobacteria bacterium]